MLQSSNPFLSSKCNCPPWLISSALFISLLAPLLLWRSVIASPHHHCFAAPVLFCCSFIGLIGKKTKCMDGAEIRATNLLVELSNLDEALDRSANSTTPHWSEKK
jgi:hypothetical protein